MCVAPRRWCGTQTDTHNKTPNLDVVCGLLTNMVFSICSIKIIRIIMVRYKMTPEYQTPDCDKVAKKLDYAVIKFSFYKKDGSLRTAIGTRNPSFTDGTVETTLLNNCVSFFDIEKKEWRQFNRLRFVKFEGEIVEGEFFSDDDLRFLNSQNIEVWYPEPEENRDYPWPTLFEYKDQGENEQPYPEAVWADEVRHRIDELKNDPMKILIEGISQVLQR